MVRRGRDGTERDANTNEPRSLRDQEKGDKSPTEKEGIEELEERQEERSHGGYELATSLVPRPSAGGPCDDSLSSSLLLEIARTAIPVAVTDAEGSQIGMYGATSGYSVSR